MAVLDFARIGLDRASALIHRLHETRCSWEPQLQQQQLALTWRCGRLVCRPSSGTSPIAIGVLSIARGKQNDRTQNYESLRHWLAH